MQSMRLDQMPTVENILKTARGYIGYKEAKNNNNIFASIAAHPNFQPWCATFVVAVFKNAGALGTIKNTSSFQIELVVDAPVLKANVILYFFW